MNHYSGRLETELASGILRAEQTSLMNSQGFFILLLEVEELDSTELEKKLKEGQEGCWRIITKKSFLENPVFSHWEFPSSFKD